MTDTNFREACQRHHDHYAKLHREGRLKEKDEPQFSLATGRERQGLVKPLPEITPRGHTAP